MRRGLLLMTFALLSCGAEASSRGQTCRTDRRDRACPDDRALSRYLPSLPGNTAQECTGNAVTGTKGEAVTVARVAGITCTRSDTTTNALGANAPSLNTDGLDVGNATTVSVANPLTALAGWCVFETVNPPSRSQWQTGGGPWVLFNVGSFGTANSLTMYYDNSRAMFLNVGDSAGVARFSQTDDVALFSGPRRVGACLLSAGAVQMYLDGYPVASHTSSGTGTDIFSAQQATVQLGGVGAGFPANLSVSDVCFAPAVSVATCFAGHMNRFNATKRIAVIGDSITGGIGAVSPYPWVLETNLASAAKQVDDYGVSGITVSAMLANWRRYVKGKGYTHVVVLGGVNDIIQGGTASATFTTLSTLYAEVRADGAILVPSTVMPFDAAGTWSAAKETERTSLNTSISSYCTTNSLTCWDASTLMKDGVDAAKLNATYDSGDGLHPNQTGHNTMATSLQTIVGP